MRARFRYDLIRSQTQNLDSVVQHQLFLLHLYKYEVEFMLIQIDIQVNTCLYSMILESV